MFRKLQILDNPYPKICTFIFVTFILLPGGAVENFSGDSSAAFNLFDRLQNNSPTNQLAVSQVADWITRGLVNSPTANF